MNKQTKLKTRKKSETILVIGAHNDDNVFGVGGTLAKYAKEGKIVKTIIFSYGELSHPHLKREVVREMRLKESINADEIIGAKGVRYLGLNEGKFPSEIKSKKIKQKLVRLIKQEKPIKIFTHDLNDPLPDHRAVNNVMLELIKEEKITCPVYSFGVWNLMIAIRKTNRPKLVVDISKTFHLKIKAIKAHKSQQVTIFNLLWSVYVKALIHGWNNNFKYAEVFFKLN